MNIILICNVPLSQLPPALSIIFILEKIGINMKLIVPSLEKQYKTTFTNLSVYEFDKKGDWFTDLGTKNLLQKFIIYRKYRNYIYDVLDEVYNKKSFIWIIHENTAMRLDKRILKYKYILSTYELSRDIKIMNLFPTEIIRIAQNASIVITPEVNRSQILAAWWNLKQIPMVIPNKPFVETNNVEIDDTIIKVIRKIKKQSLEKKIVLYQGAFGPDRRLENYIEAIGSSDNYYLVLMGYRNKYINSLIKKYGDLFLFIDGISAPKHLEITKVADIGIVNYITKSIGNYDILNIVYCAPNKIFEYSKYSIPMLCSNQLGLHYTVEKYNAGICMDSDNISDIINGLNEINNNYELYKRGATNLYKSVDLISEVSKIITHMKGELNN